MKPISRMALAALAAGLLAWTAMGQGVVLDILRGQDISPVSTDPRGFATVGATTFFCANSPTASVAGDVLCKTDGTAAGTEALVSFSENEFILELIPAGSTLFMVVRHEDGHGLWVSDGTVVGTEQILWASTITYPTASAGILYFAAEADASHGVELWSSDGSIQGTSMVRDIRTGLRGSSPSHLEDLGGVLYFSANNGVHGRELWKTNGSPLATQMVVDFLPGFLGSDPSQLTAAGSTLYFVANAGLRVGRELCRTLGDAASTILVKDIRTGSVSSQITDLEVIASSVVFSADDGAHGREPWVSTGSAGLTYLLRDIRPGSPSSNPGPFETRGLRVYFPADDGILGRELWETNRFQSGTVMTEDLRRGFESSNPSDLVAVGSNLFFEADGAVQVYDGSSFRRLPAVMMAEGAAAGGLLLFSGLDFDEYELWRSDGSVAGTFEIADLTPTNPLSSLPGNLTRFDDRLFFSATDVLHGRELWVSDGTTLGTTVFKDLLPGPRSSFPSQFLVVGQNMYFTAGIDGQGHELWITDGTPVGTRMVRDIWPGSLGSFPLDLVQMGNRLYFTAEVSSVRSLWKSDGSAGGTELVFKPGDPGMPEDFSFENRVAMGGHIYFRGYDSVNGWELWRTDGTLVNFVRAIGSGISDGLGEGPMAAYRGRVYFQGVTGSGNSELWSTDGTATDTLRVKDINSGPPGSYPDDFTVVGNTLYFSAETLTQARELWRTDGTPAGTELVQDMAPGIIPGSPRDLVAADNTLYFTGFEPDHGRELYSVAGPSAAPVLAKQINPGRAGASPSTVAHLGSNDRVILGAVSRGTGIELWRSDGTGSGTYRLTNIATPDPFGSEPRDFTRVGTTVFFTAWTRNRGRELHAISLVDAGGVLTERFGRARPGITGVRPAIRGIGHPVLGNSGFAIRLFNALPNTSAALALGTRRADIEFAPGCILYPDFPHAVVGATVDSIGDATVPIPIPNNPALIGFEFFAQWAVLDPGGCYLNTIAASTALHLMVNN